jgi:hypothetical protein
MQNDWRTQDAFGGFWDVLDSLSDTMRPMKEAMVSSFLTLMIKQVNSKHNERYLLTPKLVRAVFAEKEAGQLVAAMLISNDEEIDKPMGKYESAVHGCKIDLQRFARWLHVTISPEQLGLIQEHAVTTHFAWTIVPIRDRVNIWDWLSADELAASIRKAFLQELAAHPSTQHANKMCVKLDAMFERNKSEIWAGIFTAASNGFLLLGHDNKNDTDKDIENPSDLVNEDILEPPPNKSNKSKILEDNDDGPKRCKRYFRVNKKKLL